MEKRVWLKTKADRPVRRKHPWIFSGAVGRIEGDPEPGDLVRVSSDDGEFLAWGHWSGSRISVRLLDWSADANINETWWASGLKNAAIRRRDLFEAPDTNAFRLVYSESDLLPGLIVDWYDGWAVLQALTPGVDRIKHALADIIMRLTGARGVWERSDLDTRKLEGLAPESGLLRGDGPPERLDILENGHVFGVDVSKGQKTGFFLDQRLNRLRVSGYARGKNVLDCFAHTRAFSVYAAAAGAAAVHSIESSAQAAGLGRINMERNGFGDMPGETVVGDVFQALRRLRDRDMRFDLVILDPPKFAPTRAQVSKASRAYKDINLLAVKLLRPEGVLATFSCSGGVDAGLFQKIVFGAGLDAGREMQILESLGQGPDHPVRLAFPESAYLKGLICRVL